MQLKCSRYIFTYSSEPAIVEDYILRADDLATQTYGRDKYFSRLSQVLEQARFLGWPLPRFGSELPEELTEIPPEGVDFIFENQAKLLVDVAPATRAMLEDGRYCPVKMIASTMASGDLVWRCHLLSDKDGTPYIQRNNKKFKVKTKGTKIICQAETLPYDEEYVFECFGGKEESIWPVPFLPECFSDRLIAQKFSPEEGVVEVVLIHEENPIKVLATGIPPWYKPLAINYTKALPVSDQEFDSDSEVNVGNLVSGWDDLKENERVTSKRNRKSLQDSEDGSEDLEVGEGEDEVNIEPPKLMNVVTTFSDIEEKKFKEYEKTLSGTKISSKAEADKLRKDATTKDRAEKWLIAAVNRLRIIANAASKIGAVLNLVNRYPDKQILIIQPRPKWASKLAQVLNQRGVECELLDSEKKKQLERFVRDEIRVLITPEATEELFVEDLVVISVSAFDVLPWLDFVDATQLLYCIAIKNLELADHNFIPEHQDFMVETEEYAGAAYDILKLDSEVVEVKEETSAKETPIPSTEATPEPKESKDKEPKEPKEPKIIRPKFKIKLVGQAGKPKTAPSYEKALEMAQKYEAESKKCEIYGPENDEALYISGIGELNK